jgi:hypothetical protein
MHKEVIIILAIIFAYYLFVPNFKDEKFAPYRLLPLLLIGTFTFFSLIAYISGTFMYRTTHYTNYLKKCNNISSDQFCHIKKLNVSIPDEYIEPLLDISYKYGKRINMPQKRQTAISIKYLKSAFPNIVTWYKSLCPIISKVVGQEVMTTPLSEPNSLCLIVYDREGDFIDLHFDTNHYDGRYFTFLLPVTFEETCGNYQYKNSEEKTETLTLTKGDALLFEGDKVYHRGKKLCRNQRRVILSCTFTTSQQIPIIESIYQKIKTVGFFGEL